MDFFQVDCTTIKFTDFVFPGALSLRRVLRVLTILAAACFTIAIHHPQQLYDPSSSVCRAYLDLEAARRAGSYGQNNWGVGLPWLHYDETALEVRGDTSIEMVWECVRANNCIIATLHIST